MNNLFDLDNLELHNDQLPDSKVDDKLLRMAQVIGKFSSTLALKPITVEISTDQYGLAPAWSNSETIFFQKNLVGTLDTPDSVVSIKGLGLHESAHIMFTPRTGSILYTDVNKAGLHMAMNALEDQRIEMLMTSMFSNVSDWLKATVAKHLLDTPDNLTVLFPTLHGRKYLPLELRNQIETMYEQPEHVPRLKQLIDEYITLNLSDTKNYSRAFEIIKEYGELLNMLEPVNESWYAKKGIQRIQDVNHHSSRPNGEWKSSASRPVGKAEQQKLSDKIAGQVAKDNEDAKNKKEGEAPVGMHGESGFASADKVKDLASSIQDEVFKVRAKEIRNTIAQFNGEAELNGKAMKPLPRYDSVFQNQPSPKAVLAVRSFSRELELLKAKYDPQWNKRVDQGKLDVHRYAQGVDFDECFDEWDTGREDAVDIEAVILLDTSGSMWSNSQGAFESMWAIKRSLDKIGASTTVLTFDDKQHMLYSSDERATTKYVSSYLGGSTEPRKSIVQARSILATSNRAIKVFIPITDGWWSDSAECNRLIRELRKGGVITALAMIGAQANSNGKTVIDTHGCEVAVPVDDMSQLFRLARAMVKVGIDRNLNK